MSMKIFNYDEAGYFTTVTLAHANPEEPGQYLVPARASTMSPPTHDRATHRAKYLGNNQWQIVERNLIEMDGKVVEVPDGTDIKTLAELLLKDTMLEALEALEEGDPVQGDLLNYRRLLRAVLRGERTTLPLRVQLPKWPFIAEVK